jgi:hypothetical protein
MSSTLRFAIVAVLLTSTLALGLVIFNLTRPIPQSTVTLAPQPLTYAYLAAARVLPAGTLTRDEDFVAKAVPMSEMPPDAIQDTPEARAGIRLPACPAGPGRALATPGHRDPLRQQRAYDDVGGSARLWLHSRLPRDHQRLPLRYGHADALEKGTSALAGAAVVWAGGRSCGLQQRLRIKVL